MSTNNKLCIEINLIKYIFISIIIFEPMSISETVSGLHGIWESLRYVLYFYFILEYAISLIRNQAKERKMLFLIALFYAWQLIATYINIENSGSNLYEGSIYAILSEAFNAIGLFACVSHMLRRDFRNTLKAMAIVLGMYSIVNFVTIVIFPNGYYEIGYPGYFLGDKNNHITTSFIGTFCCLLSAIYSENKISFYSILVLAASFLSALFVGSFTSLYAFAAMVVGVIVILLNVEIKSPEKKLFVGAIGFCLVMVFFGASDFVKDLISHVTTRTITFDTRFVTWGKALKLLAGHMILGLGYINKKRLLTIIGGSHAHNYYLECLMRGGIVQVILLLVMIYLSFCKMDTWNQSVKNERRIVLLLAFSMFSIMLASVFEAYLYFRNFFVVFLISDFTLSYSRNLEEE